MKNKFLKIMLFLVIMSSLLGFSELLSNTIYFIYMVVGIIIVYIRFKTPPKKSVIKGVGLVIGLALIFMTGLTTAGFWLALTIIIFVTIFYGKELLTGKESNLFNNPIIHKKEYRAIKTIEPTPNTVKRFKQSWIGTTTIGQDIYEWDDINIISHVGDTIIDLGNTILPNDENIIVIRKGIGSTRIIVPIGVGVLVHHSSFSGTIIFNKEKIDLNNESITVQSESYAKATKKIKLYTSTLIGELEVIEL